MAKRGRKSSKESGVYVVRTVDLSIAKFKIGKSMHVNNRVRQLQMGSPVDLELVHMIPWPELALAYTGISLGPDLERAAWAKAIELGFERSHGEWFTGAITAELAAQLEVPYDMRDVYAARGNALKLMWTGKL